MKKKLIKSLISGIWHTRYKKLYLTSVIVKELPVATSAIFRQTSIKITASKVVIKKGYVITFANN